MVRTERGTFQSYPILVEKCMNTDQVMGQYKKIVLTFMEQFESLYFWSPEVVARWISSFSIDAQIIPGQSQASTTQALFVVCVAEQWVKCFHCIQLILKGFSKNSKSICFAEPEDFVPKISSRYHRNSFSKVRQLFQQKMLEVFSNRFHTDASLAYSNPDGLSLL